MPKLIRDRLLQAFADDERLNPSVLARLTVIPGEDIGIGEKTIQALLANPGRVPELRTLVAIARALKEDPETYYEWPLAKARADAAATPEAARRRAVEATRKAASRKAARTRDPQPSETPPTPQTGRRAKRGKDQAA